MSGSIVIEFDRSEGAILRVIGLVERRGFEVVAIDMTSQADRTAHMTLFVTPRDPSRRYETLARHVAKLHGVHRVSAAPQPCTPLESA